MNNENLVIYDFKILYEILNEIDNYINFKLIYVDKISDPSLKEQNNYLLISNKKVKDIENQIILNNLPIRINKLIENINIRFLKKKYSQQSAIELGVYILNLNSRKIFKNKKSLDLTERETKIIIFLNDAQEPVKISKLQTEVWGHNSKLDTHTVETHIYRLRTKINKSFKDNNFIKSTKQGYLISV